MSTPGLIPDGTGWVDAYGRPWISSGDDMLLWELPSITIVGDNPLEIIQNDPYVEQGATAIDAQGTSLTDDIVIDSSAVDTSEIGDYPVTYNVTDSEGYAAPEQIRMVHVVDSLRSDVRYETFRLLNDALPEYVNVYRTSTEQMKAPAVIVGDLAWEPDRMNSLDRVTWEISTVLAVLRARPDYTQISLETLSLAVGQALVEANYRVIGFTPGGTDTIGGVDYLVGNVSAIYKENN